MPEQPLSDPFETYAALFERRNQLTMLRQSAVDATVGKSVQASIDIVDGKLAQLAQDPSFSEQVFARLDQTATALDQLDSLQDILPADQLAETKMPYETTARLGLGIAANLRLDDEKAKRLTALQAKLGALSAKTEVALLLPKTTPAQAQNTVAPETGRTEENSSAQSQEFLDSYFSKTDALIILRFLGTADNLIKAHHLPALGTEVMQRAIEYLSQDEAVTKGAQLDTEELQRTRIEIVSRIEDFIEDGGLLGKLLECLTQDDPRLELIEYFYLTLDQVTRKSLGRLAEVHLESIMTVESPANTKHTSVKPSDPGKAPQAAACPPAERTAVTPEEVSPTEILSIPAEELLNECTTQIELIRQKFVKTGLKRGEMYEVKDFCASMKIPRARALGALKFAKEAGLFSPESGRQVSVEDKMTITSFIKLMLHASPRLSEMVAQHGKQVEDLIRSKLDPKQR